MQKKGCYNFDTKLNLIQVPTKVKFTNLPSFRSDEFESHVIIMISGGFTDNVLSDVFIDESKAAPAPHHHSYKQWGITSYWKNAKEMIGKIEDPACKQNLCGLVIHQHEHWIAYRLQSSGLFVRLDSQYLVGEHPVFGTPISTKQLVRTMQRAVFSHNQNVFLIFKNAAPIWKSTAEDGPGPGDELVELTSEEEEEEEDDGAGGESCMTHTWIRSYGLYQALFKRTGTGALLGYTVFEGASGIKLVSCPHSVPNSEFSKTERIVLETFAKKYAELSFEETKQVRYSGYEKIKSQTQQTKSI